MGLFSFAAAVAAGQMGHVLAIEPDAVLVNLLRRSAASNRRHAPVEVLPVALADGFGVAHFNIARRNRSTSHLDGFGTSQAGGVRTKELVPTVSLDWLANRFPRPDVIKIDVEGAEVGVLAGGHAVLSAGPRIICEVAADNAAEVHSLLAAHGYTLYDGDRPDVQRVPMDTATPSTLAINEPDR
jgi:FkbM family methyltransferase